MMLTVCTLLCMIHESVTITVLPPSAVCAGEGEKEGEREGEKER